MCVLLASSTKKKIHILLILIEKVISLFTVLIFVDISFPSFWLDLRKNINVSECVILIIVGFEKMNQ